mmetsp:Transcript_127294/g.407464  ORF Transcript_127294/g.407464 Transcript_127294/m.407464 type:complete len:846 (-) Transcript_127294:30-2567(-)
MGACNIDGSGFQSTCWSSARAQPPVNGPEEEFVAGLLDDTIALCRSVLEGSWNVAWRAGRLRLALMESERGVLQKQLAQIERRPEDMKLACEYHRRCARYDEDRVQILNLSKMLESERGRWLHTAPPPAWAAAAADARVGASAGRHHAAVSSTAIPAAPPWHHPPPLPSVGPTVRGPATATVAGRWSEEYTAGAPRRPSASPPLPGNSQTGTATCGGGKGMGRRSVVQRGPLRGGGKGLGEASRRPREGMLKMPESFRSIAEDALREEAACATSGDWRDVPEQPACSPARGSGYLRDVPEQPACSPARRGGYETVYASDRGAEELYQAPFSSASSSSSALPPVPAAEVAGERALLECLDQHLQGTVALRSQVAHAFAAECVPEQRSLDLAGLRDVAASLARHMRVPHDVFGDIEDEYVRFDFNGDSTLQEHECFRLVRHHLREYRKRLGHVVYEVDVPYETLEEARYKVLHKLGEGAQGVCQLAQLPSGVKHCIKILKKESAMTRLDELKDEIHILGHAHNNHIIRIFSIFQDDRHFYLASEPYFGPDFADLRACAQRQAVEMTEGWWRDLFRQCFHGLLYMHQHALMHCDIKEPNIMLKLPDMRRPEIVFIDFGLAQEFAHAQVVLCGTPGYIPPETWRSRKWFPKGDVFCMGVCMLHLLLGRSGIFTDGARLPPKGLEDIAAFTTSRPPPLDQLPPALGATSGLLGGLLAKDMATRMNAFQALEHPWFQVGSAVASPLPPSSATSATYPSPSASPLPSVSPLPSASSLRLPPWASSGAGAGGCTICSEDPGSIGGAPSLRATAEAWASPTADLPLAPSAFTVGHPQAEIAHGPAGVRRRIALE